MMSISVKMRRIAILVVVVILIRCNVADILEEAMKHSRDISLAYPSAMLSVNNFVKAMFQFIKVNRKCLFISIKFAHDADHI